MFGDEFIVIGVCLFVGFALMCAICIGICADNNTPLPRADEGKAQ
jgi:F0F1-type ATP synthase membrane subunit c/vacuolar-type H+-ATPase subunit K